MNCAICDTKVRFRWTDTHGVGACLKCGTPYTLYHYEGEGEQRKRVDKPPSLCIKPEYVELTRRCWAETGRNVAPGAFNFPGSSYEVASREDFKINSEWWEKNDMLTARDQAGKEKP